MRLRLVLLPSCIGNMAACSMLLSCCHAVAKEQGTVLCSISSSGCLYCTALQFVWPTHIA
jgi:hypothetical protein